MYGRRLSLSCIVVFSGARLYGNTMSSSHDHLVYRSLRISGANGEGARPTKKHSEPLSKYKNTM